MASSRTRIARDLLLGLAFYVAAFLLLHWVARLL